MDSNSESDSDCCTIFRETRIKPVVKLPRQEKTAMKSMALTKEGGKIVDKSVTQGIEKKSPMDKCGKRKVIFQAEEEDEEEIVITDVKTSPSSGINSQTCENGRVGGIFSTPVKNKSPNKSQANLITSYFSPGKKSNTTSNKLTNLEDKMDSPNSSIKEISVRASNMYKKVKLDSVSTTSDASNTLVDVDYEGALQEEETILKYGKDFFFNINNISPVAKSPVKRENSSFYCQSLRNIVCYEMEKQQRLQKLAMEAEQNKFEDLFLPMERDYFSKIFQLPREACLLFARMLCRKKHWHRASTIEYSDISNNITEVFIILGKENFFNLNIANESMELLLELLNKNELNHLSKMFKIKVDKGKSSKKNLIDAVLKNCKTQRSAMDMWNKNTKSRLELVKVEALKLLGTCGKIDSSALSAFNRLLLLFSLTHDVIEEDRWSIEMQAMMGHMFNKIRYPDYNVRPTVIFETRNDFISYEKAMKHWHDYEAASENKNHSECIRVGKQVVEEFDKILQDEEFKNRFSTLPSYLRKFNAGTVYAKILTQYCQQNKRIKDPDELVEILHKLISQGLFLVVKKGDWYNLLVQAYETVGKPEEAVTTLRIALEDKDVNDVQRLALQLKGLALLKKKKNNVGNLALKEGLENLCTVTLSDPAEVEIKARALGGNEPGCKIVYVVESKSDKTYSSVEEYAISYYEKNGFTDGIHSEGSIIQTIYFLIFFNIIYGPSPPGVFQSRFQKQPMDLASRSFYVNRKDAIDERLNEIKTWTINDFKEAIDIVFTVNAGVCCVVNWADFDPSFLCDIVKCLGLKKLALICERLVGNFKVYRSGFPDLTVWNPETGKCKFVEIKSPNDKLSPNQKLWLDFLGKHDIDCEVCYVTDKCAPHRRRN